MLTLDSDRYPYNGVVIESVITVKEPIDFSLDPIAFQNNKNVLAVLNAYSQSSQLVASSEVKLFIDFMSSEQLLHH